MRLLLTGATGLIGRKLLPELVNAGFSAVAAGRNSAPPAWLPAGVDWQSTDLLDPVARRRLVETASASHLVHLAWHTAPGSYIDAAENDLWLQASQDLLACFADGGGRRVVLAGSCAQYDWDDPSLADQLCRETATPTGGRSRFARARQALEDWLLARPDLSAACGRIFFVFGDGEDPRRLVPSLACRLLRGEVAETGPGDLVRDFLCSTDVAAAIAALLQSSVTGPVNIASGDGTRIADLAGTVADLVGRPDLLRIGALPGRAGESPRLVADVTRLHQEVGFRPTVGLDARLAETVAWWRAELGEVS